MRCREQWGFAEQPRLMYYEVVDMEGQLDDAAGLLG